MDALSNNPKITARFFTNPVKIQARFLTHQGEITARIGSYQPKSLLDRIKRTWGKRSPAHSYGLTNSVPHGIIPLPFPLEAVGIINPFLQGLKMTAPFSGFFVSAIRRVNACLFNYGGLYGAAFGWAAPCSGVDNPIQSATKLLSKFAGGLSTFTRINPMSQNQSVLNPQTKTVSLFNVFHHRQLIAQGVTDSLALRLKGRYPACIVKFSGFAGGAA